MKTFLSLLTGAFLLSMASLQAQTATPNRILIYKVVTAHAGTSYFDDTAPAVGYAPSNFSYTDTSYYVVNLTTQEVWETSLFSSTTAEPAVDKNNAAIAAGSKKIIFADQSGSPLSNYMASPQPLKGAGNYLWNGLWGGDAAPSPQDTNGDQIDDDYFASFEAGQLTGKATPLVVPAKPTAITIPNVARTVSEKTVRDNVDVATIDIVDPDTGDVFKAGHSFTRSLITSTWTLDIALTNAVNTLAITGTADMGSTASLAIGTSENGMQRVHDLLYLQGYRISAPLP